LVSPSGSVLNPAGGHFGEGEGDNFDSFFFTGAFFFAGGFFFAGAFFFSAGFLTGAFSTAFFSTAFLETLVLGVGLGDFVAAEAGVTVKTSPTTRASDKFLYLIISVDPI
jgi:hypothetical protein